MENNYNTPDLTPKSENKQSPVDNLTLDPFGYQAQIDQAKEEVTAEQPAEQQPVYTQPEEQPNGQQPNYQQQTYAQQPNYQQQPYTQQPNDQQQPNYQQQTYPQQTYTPPPVYQQSTYVQPMVEQKSKIAAGLFGIFLGGFGIHNFYLGKTRNALIQLLLTVLSCGLLSFIPSIWGLVEGILILTGSINVDGRGIPLKD